jgi:hypothetical protein
MTLVPSIRSSFYEKDYKGSADINEEKKEKKRKEFPVFVFSSTFWDSGAENYQTSQWNHRMDP